MGSLVLCVVLIRLGLRGGWIKKIEVKRGRVEKSNETSTVGLEGEMNDSKKKIK